MDVHVAPDRVADRRRVDGHLLGCDARLAVLDHEANAQARDVAAVGRDGHVGDDDAGQVVAVAGGNGLSERELDLDRWQHTRRDGRGDHRGGKQPETTHHPDLLLEAKGTCAGKLAADAARSQSS